MVKVTIAVVAIRSENTLQIISSMAYTFYLFTNAEPRLLTGKEILVCYFLKVMLNSSDKTMPGSNNRYKNPQALRQTRAAIKKRYEEENTPKK
jgi:hypothetical protein